MCHNLSFLNQGTAGLNSDLSFSKTGCITKAKELSLPYYLLMTGREKIDILRIFTWSEMSADSSRIWTQLIDSISYDDNRYSKWASI